MQLYVTYTCGNKINNKDKQTQFFGKIYLSHFIHKGCEMVVFERWVGDWADRSILTPSSSDNSSTSFLILLSCSTRGPEGPALCWELVLTASNCNSNFNCNWLQLSRTLCGTGLYNCLTSTCFLWHRNCTEFNPSPFKVIPWYLRPDAPVIYTGASLIWQLGQGSICNNNYVSLINQH